MGATAFFSAAALDFALATGFRATDFRVAGALAATPAFFSAFRANSTSRALTQRSAYKGDA